MDMDNFNFGNGTNNNTNNTKYEYKIRSTCYECIDGYIKEGEENPCLPLGIENCSLSSLFDLNTSNFKEEEYYYKDFWKKYHKCERLCSGSKYVKINYYYETTEQVKVRYESNNTGYDFYNNNTYNTDGKDEDGSDERPGTSVVNPKEEKEIIEVLETKTVGHYLYMSEGLTLKI